MTKQYFSAGCGLRKYKEDIAQKLSDFLSTVCSHEEYNSCCKAENTKLTECVNIINTCPSCDRKFSDRDGVSTEMLWEVLDRNDIPLPSYKGLEVTIHDSCSIRGQDSVYDAVRNLLKKMDVKIVETSRNRSKSVCCGSTLEGKVTNELLVAHMQDRAAELPLENVVVYCTGCFRRMQHVGKKTLHIADMILGQEPDYTNTGIERFIKRTLTPQEK